jgi:uncharacterized protein YbjT (DUF2867 family)
MYIVLGATGHVGSEVALQLLSRGEQVTIVTRSAARGEALRSRGAQVAVLDVRDSAALSDLFRRGKRAFLLNPPGDPTGDVVAEERASATSVARAVAASHLEHVVLQSTYGAQPGDTIGDLGVLYELEQQLAAQDTPLHVVRGAYYMSNWDASLAATREGQLQTFFPGAFRLPMVAPADLGEQACSLLRSPPAHSSLTYVEGPARYSSDDVARAFATALGRKVEVQTVDERAWETALHGFGFSERSARAMAGMTRITLHERYELPAAPRRGRRTLDEYIAALVHEAP